MFKLVRYFSITSFVATGVVAALLGMFYRRIAIGDLIELGQSNNVALTQAFANSLWPEFAPFVTSVSGLNGDQLRAHPVTPILRNAVLAQMRGLPVVKIKVYNLAGLTVFSTEERQIGEDKSGNAGFLSARSGKVASELTHRDTFSAFEQTIEDRDLISSYLPIRRGEGSPVEGVFEIYYDATSFVQKTRQTQTVIVIGVVLILSLLYWALLLIVRRADKIIQRQDSERRQYLDEIQRAKETLEQRVSERTRELSALYAALSPLTPFGSIHGILDGIIEKLMDATGADAALIRVRDNTTGTYPRASQRGFPDYYLKTVGTAPPGGAMDLVFKTDEPVISSDIASDSRFKGKVQLQVGLCSCALLPMKVHDQIRGVIHLASRSRGFFDEAQREHLMAIARQMGIALENQELFNDLKNSRDDLERASNVKDEFLSVMSHELRTPLNVVMGYTAMIKDRLLGDINPQQEAALDKIIRQGNDQIVMVSNILQATAAEAEKIKIDNREVSLGDLLTQLRSVYDLQTDKGIAFNWDYPAALPVIKTDIGKLNQILQNLINNALKFTTRGSITIAARIKEGSGERDAGNGQIEFKVTDTGIGIPPEMVPLVFEKFRQVDSSETRPYGGVGMGLYIVKKFTELLGGTVEVESEPGKGSTFTVTIPVE